MKITILAYLEKEGGRPDPVVSQVREALAGLGHAVSVCAVHDNVRKLISGIQRRKPDLVFNLMEMFDKNLFGDVAVAGLLDLLGVRYTGGGPGELYLQQDKAITKKLLAFAEIAYPEFTVYSTEMQQETGGSLRMPLFVKPLRADASIGINGDAVVYNQSEMKKQVAVIHETVQDAALVEEFIKGREFSVGVLGNDAGAIAFPPMEIDFSALPQGKPRVLDRRAKWSRGSVEYQGTKAGLAQVPDDLKTRLMEVSLETARALRIRDYGRIDLRLKRNQEIFVIEANANCYLEKTSEFAQGAKAAGLEYPELIARIVELAQARYGCRPGAERSASGT